LRADIEACFNVAPAGSVDTHTEHDKGHGRIEQRDIGVLRDVDWLSGERRFPGELRLPDASSIIRVRAQIQRGQTPHAETRYYMSSAALGAERAGQAVRGHWGSKTGCTGCSTSRTTRISRGYERNLAPVTWPSFAISL
jgi:hypothetical protein